MGRVSDQGSPGDGEGALLNLGATQAPREHSGGLGIWKRGWREPGAGARGARQVVWRARQRELRKFAELGSKPRAEAGGGRVRASARRAAVLWGATRAHSE